MSAKRSDVLYILVLLASGIVFFIPNLGQVHLFDWDEINFAESAREMIVTGNYGRVQVNFQPFWEKPPLFFWLQCISMTAFGVNEFAARLPNALFGILSLLTLYLIGRKTVDQRFGFLWAVCYLGSFLPHLYFKSGIIDPVFNYFIFMGVYFGFRDLNGVAASRSAKNAALSGMFIGLSNLTKGPVGLLIFLLTFTSYWLAARCRRMTSFKNVLVFAMSFVAVSLMWFGMEVMHNGLWFVIEFVKYQAELFATPVAGHHQPIYYHFAVVMVGCFPMSIFALPVLFRSTADDRSDFFKLMRILFWVVMILFTLVSTKILHYSSLSYFPLSCLASAYIHRLTAQGREIGRLVWWSLLVMGSVLCIGLVGVPWLAQHGEWIVPYLRNGFTVACLKSQVVWHGYECVIGVVYFAALITGLIMIRRNNVRQGGLMLFSSTAVCVCLFVLAVFPKIDSYYQAPAINFYKSLAGKDAYVMPIGFKSYAHYFYAQKMAKYSEDEEDYLLKGDIDKPAYFVTKVTDTEFPTANPECQLIRQEGGYVFYSRMPKQTTFEEASSATEP